MAFSSSGTGSDGVTRNVLRGASASGAGAQTDCTPTSATKEGMDGTPTWPVPTWSNGSDWPENALAAP